MRSSITYHLWSDEGQRHYDGAFSALCQSFKPRQMRDRCAKCGSKLHYENECDVQKIRQEVGKGV